MASSTPAFTPTKRVGAQGSTPWTYSWVKKPLSRSPGLLRTPPQRVPSATAGPLVPPSTGGATAATVNTVGMGCEYSFVPERPEPGEREREEERPAWDSSLKDASIYRLPPEEMARRKARLQSPHNIFHRPPQDKAKANNKAGKRAGAKTAFASSAPAAPFEPPAAAPTAAASPLRGGAGGRRRLAASLAAVSDDEGLITRRRREQRRLLSASFSSATGAGRSQSAPRGARLSASAGSAPAAPQAPSLSQSFVASKGGGRKQQQQQQPKKAGSVKPQSSSLLGVVDLEQELAAFERRLQRAREDFDLPSTTAPPVVGGDDGDDYEEGGEGLLAANKGKGSKNTKAKGTGPKKQQGGSGGSGGFVTAAIKPKPRPTPTPAPAPEEADSEEEEEESEDILLPFSASAPAAAFVPPRLQARLVQSAEAAAARRRGLSASTGSAPFSSSSAAPKPPVGRIKTTTTTTTEAAAGGAGHDGKQDVGRAKSMGAPPAAQATAPKPPAVTTAPAAPVSAEEALLAAVLELDEQWEAGADGSQGPESPLLANKSEAVALGRALEQWRQHQHEGGPATHAADMLLRLCARLLRRVGGLQQRNRGLEARVGKLEAQVGAFAVQLSALRGGAGVGGVPLPATEPVVAPPSLHASRVAFEDGEGEEEVDGEERFRPLKKRLDDLNASLSAAVPTAAPAASRTNKPAYHAPVDTGLAAEEERQRVMAMMQDMFKQSAGSSAAPLPQAQGGGGGGKRLGQAKGPLVGSNMNKQQPGSVMEIGTWRRPGAWAGRSKAQVPH